jgi:IS30 family transposase
MDKVKKYSGLSDTERSEIEILLKKGYSQRDIAKVLDRSPNTISYEIKTNSVRNKATGELEYIANKAKVKSRVSRRNRRFQWYKIEQNVALRNFIIQKLKPPCYWSPDAIAGYLKTQQVELPYVSSTQIYHWLYSSLGQPYCQYLCTKRYKRKTRIKKTERVMIPDRNPITDRPETVDDRSVPGNWEFDTVVSSKKSGSTYALAVVQERCTKLLRVRLVPNLKPSPYAETIGSLVKDYVALTMTTDNGIENKQHQLITQATGATVYFTDPFSSYQKGGVENANKMIRRYFPKGTNFSNINQADVDYVVAVINNKPRRCLGYKTALQYAQEKGLLLNKTCPTNALN